MKFIKIPIFKSLKKNTSVFFSLPSMVAILKQIFVQDFTNYKKTTNLIYGMKNVIYTFKYIFSYLILKII
jgi:hypothetical protein